MTAPAEDPHGRSDMPDRPVHPPIRPPAAGRGDTDSGDQQANEYFTVTLNGQNVVVAEVPELTERGLTSLTYDYRHSVQVRSFDDLDGRVLLHEFLHALLRTDPQQVCPAGDDRHEDFVRMLTAGLHDVLGYRRPAARPAGDRAQPTQELREAIGRTLSETVLRLRFSDDDAPWPSDDDVSVLSDALLAGPLAALVDAQAAVDRVEAAINRHADNLTPTQRAAFTRALVGAT